MTRASNSALKRRPKTASERSNATEREKRLRDALERQIVTVEDSVARIKNKVYHKELLRALPLNSIFSHLTEYEEQLARLTYLDNMSAKEVALHLGTADVAKIHRDLNRLRNKIRQRLKTLLNKDPAANELLLAWQGIHDKRHRMAS